MITTAKTTEEGRGKGTDGKISCSSNSSTNNLVLLGLLLCSHWFNSSNNLAPLWLLHRWHHLHCNSNHLLVLW